MAGTPLISDFPMFTRVDIGHADKIRALTQDFPPYSDFNFLSLYSWSIDTPAEVALLHGNLVIRQPDYISGDTIYSFMGMHKLKMTAHELLRYTSSLHLIPHEIAIQLATMPQQFTVVEDADNFDYVYSIPLMAELAGGAFKGKRKLMSRFAREYGSDIAIVSADISSRNTKGVILQIFNAWAMNQQKDGERAQHERLALQRFLDIASRFNTMTTIIGIGQRPVGFSLHEFIDARYAVCHFHKTLLEYEGIDVFFTNHVNRELHTAGCKLVNWEQDLGIPGLRALKMSYGPSLLFKKYLVTATLRQSS